MILFSFFFNIQSAGKFERKKWLKAEYYTEKEAREENLKEKSG